MAFLTFEKYFQYRLFDAVRSEKSDAMLICSSQRCPGSEATYQVVIPGTTYVQYTRAYGYSNTLS